MQVPHMDEDRIKQLRKKKKLSIEEYCALTPQERMDLSIFDNSQ